VINDIDFSTFHGMNVIIDPNIPLFKFNKIKRTWKERLFTKPLFRKYRFEKVITNDSFRIGNTLFVNHRVYNEINKLDFSS